MKIPDVQNRLRELAHVHGINELSTLADQLSRRRPKHVAPKSSATLTDELADRIRAYKAANPNATYMQTAIRFGVNVGRISEVLRGFRQ